MSKLRIPKSGQPLPPATQLKKLPADKRAEIMSWKDELSLADARARLKERFGISLSSDGRLSEFYSWQFRQSLLEGLNSSTEQFEQWYAKRNPTASRERIREAGIAFFMNENLTAGDQKGFALFADLSMQEDSGKTKGRQKDEQLALARQKFARETCELFLKWYADAKARSIAESNASNSEKIRLLRETYFADVEELEKSGSVKLPK